MVTPFAGVWIEIWKGSAHLSIPTESLPSRECGLKSPDKQPAYTRQFCHSLRGSVD